MLIKDRNNKLKFIRIIFASIFSLIIGTAAYWLFIKSNPSENPSLIMYAVFVGVFAFIHFLLELIEKKLEKYVR